MGQKIFHLGQIIRGRRLLFIGWKIPHIFLKIWYERQTLNYFFFWILNFFELIRMNMNFN